MYRGSTFGDLFDAYAKVSGKPLLIGEYGIDAYDASVYEEDQLTHAQYTMNLVEELERHSVACVANCEGHVASGGFIMSWVDEYWKEGQIGPECPQFDNAAQSPCGSVRNMDFPDEFMNEEWWGMLTVARGCTLGDTDILTPRLAYLEVCVW